MKKAFVLGIAFGAPVVWFLNQEAQFALAPETCPWQSNLVLWIVSVVSLALVAGSGLFAWTQWNRGPEQDPQNTALMPRWLSMSGLVLSASFFIVIVAQAIPSLILQGCE